MVGFCVVVITVCCLITGSCGADDAAATKECSVERSGVLTMFNGQTSTVAVPCKYRLADIQCGDYRLRVTLGSQLDSINTFSPYSVFVKMQKTGLAGYAWVRTTFRRLKKFARGKVEKPWYEKRGNLSSFGLDLAGYDSANQAAVLRKDGVFEVEFSADQARAVVRCFSDSFSTPQPDALCGDGQPGDAATEEEILDMVFTNNEVFQRQRPSCSRAVSVYQECPAGVNNTRSCSDVLLNQATVDCLAASDTSIIDHYHRCLLAVCDVDKSALDPTLAYIEHNCALDPGSDCSTATFVKCDSKSTCEGGAICKRELNQTCAGFSDHCVNGTTCERHISICINENTEYVGPCGGYKYGFECQSDGECVPYHYTCDGERDCTDDSDEDLEWCPPREECSGPHKFQCDNGKCEVIDYRCDREDDCGDGSDERNCLEYECPEGKWRCPEGVCIYLRYLCDGEEDCDDGSDELPENCPDT